MPIPAELATQAAADGPGPSGRIFAIANQKGGVGKTTTAINLGTAMASVGRKVLVIDLDPQGNASTGLGVRASERSLSTHDLLTGQATIAAAAIPAADVPNLAIVPAKKELSGADRELLDEADGRHRLKNVLTKAREHSSNGVGGFDYVLIDCPPSLNILTVNALVASDGVLVPLQCEFFALEGLSQLLNTIQRIRKNLNPQLGLQGVVLTMFDKRNKAYHGDVADEAHQVLGDLVYKTIVPRAAKISEATSHGQPGLVYDRTSPGTIAYADLAIEVLSRERDPVA